jgi:hypothetical protein
MSQINIILVHAGTNQIPSHAAEALRITQKIAKKSRIIFLANEINRIEFKKIIHSITSPGGSTEFFAIEDIPEGGLRKKFKTDSLLDRSFRDGFWFHASDRFLILADYINHARLRNVLHIENDYVLYFDPTEKYEAFSTFSDFSVPVDRGRAIPGIVWLKDASVAQSLASFIVQNAHKDDMETVGQFCLTGSEVIKKPFPTIPYEYASEKGFSIERFSTGIDLFGGIFDAAAIGQYIGGIHWMNNPADTIFFINESSDLNLNELSFSWGIHNGIRRPHLIYQGKITPVLGIHAHSKNLEGISPFNHGVPSDESAIVNGEKIQAACDITLSTSSITKFHGRSNIKSKELIELLEDSSGNLLPPSTELIQRITKAKTIFVYTHLIPYFKYFLAPRFTSTFTLVSHNSDHPVTVMDFQLLNHPNLKNWYSQNCEFSHTKLKPLPIGLQNSQWGPEKANQLINASKDLIKTKLLYVNFSTQTHPSRIEALTEAKNITGATIESSISYVDYLKNLASHKFCLCPRGNGIDTHRFWEAQYLECIPVILWCDWTPAYSELPILIIDSWAELNQIDLEKIYIAVTNKKYSRSNLFLSNIIQQINYD